MRFRSSDPRGFMDALALVFLDTGTVRTPAYYSMLRTAVRQEFSGSPQLPSILQLIDNRTSPGNVQHLTVPYQEVHYERHPTTGAQQLQVFGLTGRMTVYRTSDELRVIVRIRFVDGNNPTASFYMFPDPSTHSNWQRAITRFWNNKFMLTNGVQNLRFVVAPMFYYESGATVDRTVRVFNSLTASCAAGLSPGRANGSCWFTQSSDDTIAHEFGHLLGASDEYNLPGSIAEIPASVRSRIRNPQDLNYTTVEGITGTAAPFRTGGHDINSLMGSHNASSDVHARHIQRLVDAMNSTLPSGVPQYRIQEL